MSKNTVTVAEATKAKQNLERDIKAAIRGFEERTGLGVQSVRLHVGNHVDGSTMVMGVQATVEIGGQA